MTIYKPLKPLILMKGSTSYWSSDLRTASPILSRPNGSLIPFHPDNNEFFCQKNESLSLIPFNDQD